MFKRYDVRGKFPEELDEEFAERIGKAVGTLALREYSGEIAVCRDNKQSSKPLKKKLVEGIRSTGCDVYNAGEGPTDYAAFTGRIFDAVSVHVTSSHLPLNFNGFKLMYPEGNGFLNKDLNKLEQLFRSEEFEKGTGNLARAEKASKKQYRQQIKDFVEKFPGSLDKKVVVDTVGGATREALPELLEELGAELIDVGEEKPEGPYYDPPKPDPELLEDLEKKVEEEKAALGVATDLDGDRLVVYFEGHWLKGDQLFGILAKLVEGGIVASVDTSKTVEEVAADEVYYTRVGDPFVIDEAIEQNVELAGEPNGHYCFPEFIPYNSGTLAALIATKIDLEEKLDKLPEYFTREKAVEVEDKNQRIERIRTELPEDFKILSEIDGVKLEKEVVNVLIRASGTSPKIRLKGESKNQEKLEEVMAEVEELVRKA